VEQLARRLSQCDVLIEKPDGEVRLEDGQFARGLVNLTIVKACVDAECQRHPYRLIQAAEKEVK
jgi:hypothetical protein